MEVENEFDLDETIPAFVSVENSEHITKNALQESLNTTLTFVKLCVNVWAIIIFTKTKTFQSTSTNLVIFNCFIIDLLLASFNMLYIILDAVGVNPNDYQFSFIVGINMGLNLCTFNLLIVLSVRRFLYGRSLTTVQVIVMNYLFVALVFVITIVVPIFRGNRMNVSSFLSVIGGLTFFVLLCIVCVRNLRVCCPKNEDFSNENQLRLLFPTVYVLFAVYLLVCIVVENTYDLNVFVTLAMFYHLVTIANFILMMNYDDKFEYGAKNIKSLLKLRREEEGHDVIA